VCDTVGSRTVTGLPSEAVPPSTRTPLRAWGALLALSTAAFLYVTSETLPIGLLQPIGTDLNVSDSAVGLLVTYYGLVVVFTSLPLTQLTRGVPRRALLSVLLAVFVISTIVSAVVDSYLLLLCARVITAVSQALFWSVVVPTTASLFRPQIRGRVLAVLFAGSSLAAVIGVPAGTWLGQQLGWRAAFVALGTLALLTMIAVAVFLPTSLPGWDEGGRGSRPDVRRFSLLIAITVLVVTGAFTFFTYVSPYLTDSVSLSPQLVSAALLLRGVAGLVGVVLGGVLADRRPRMAIALPVGVQTVALLGLRPFADRPAVALGLVALTGLAFAALTTALAPRVLEIAPVNVALAASGISTAVNVGITLGALLGSNLLPAFGAPSTAVVGGLLTMAGLVLALGEPLLRRRARVMAELEWADLETPMLR
jgi:DHA1 family inner membrane transport protein